MCYVFLLFFPLLHSLSRSSHLYLAISSVCSAAMNKTHSKSIFLPFVECLCVKCTAVCVRKTNLQLKKERNQYFPIDICCCFPGGGFSVIFPYFFVVCALFYFMPKFSLSLFQISQISATVYWFFIRYVFQVCAIYQWKLIVSNSKYLGSSGFCAQCTSIDGNQNAWKRNIPIERKRQTRITVST